MAPGKNGRLREDIDSLAHKFDAHMEEKNRLVQENNAKLTDITVTVARIDENVKNLNTIVQGLKKDEERLNAVETKADKAEERSMWAIKIALGGGGIGSLAGAGSILKLMGII